MLLLCVPYAKGAFHGLPRRWSDYLGVVTQEASGFRESACHVRFSHQVNGAYSRELNMVIREWKTLLSKMDIIKPGV